MPSKQKIKGFSKVHLKHFQEVPWLEGYVVYQGKKSVPHTMIKAISNMKKEIAPSADHVHAIRCGKFTVIKAVELRFLLEHSKYKHKDAYVITKNVLNEESQAKLLHQIENATRTPAAVSLANEMKKEHEMAKARLLTNYPHVFAKPTTQKKPFASRLVPKPFRYFGNSTNYLEEIERILNASSAFHSAKIIRDITCGSAIFTMYFGKKFPNKKFVASDINPEVINMLNYIKHTDINVIAETYKKYHRQKSGKSEDRSVKRAKQEEEHYIFRQK